MKFALLLLWTAVVSGHSHRHRDFYDSCESSSSSEEDHPRPPPRPHVPPCQEGWTAFDRPQGRWCVKVFPGQGAYNEGEAFCGRYGAKLTGIQNGTERQILADLALSQNQGASWTVASTWIGSVRSVGSTFVWTDGHTTGVEGFKWGATQPDAQSSGGVVQNCVQQFIITPAYWRNPGWQQMFHHGDLDDWYCHLSTGHSPYVRFFACGKKP